MDVNARHFLDIQIYVSAAGAHAPRNYNRAKEGNILLALTRANGATFGKYFKELKEAIDRASRTFQWAPTGRGWEQDKTARGSGKRAVRHGNLKTNGVQNNHPP